MTDPLELTHPGRHDDCGAAFWPTPAWCVVALMEAHPPPPGTIVEPSAGNGAIVEVLRAGYQREVVAVELREECFDAIERAGASTICIGDWPELVRQDRLALPEAEAWSIVGNPPYDPAPEMLRHVQAALESEAQYVAMLLPTSFLHSKGRSALHQRWPLQSLVALARRPKFAGPGGSRDVSWFIWDDSAVEQRIVVVP